MNDESPSAITRRAFGQILGAAALSATLPELSFGETPPNELRGDPLAMPAVAGDELCDLTALDLASRIRRKQVSAREVMTAHLSRIERINPKINAIVTLVAERAMADAAKADQWQARGKPLGVLHGLPMAHKDLVNTAGIRTTFGSPLYKNNVPTTDDLIVRRVRDAGAITVGKTNTPEFGAGSNTFNAVFGATLNPYDTRKTVGGSSGGAGAALRCGMVPIAGGSDTGGSLRNPAAWTNVVGLRPSPRRVPGEGGSWSPLTTAGPMARTVSDVALLLSVMAGRNELDPLMIAESGVQFRASLDRNFRSTRVAWFTTLGGIPFEPEITRVVNGNRQAFADLGCIVENAEPDFTGVDEAFATLRHLSYHASYARLAGENPTMFKDTIKWEIAEAERQSAADVARAMARQARLYVETSRFFEKYEYFVLPVTQVQPFDIATEYPTSINGLEMGTYIDWMRSCWYITLTACPAISVPAGFTASGLPVGLQIVGRHRGDWSVLQMARAFERVSQFGRQKPDLAAIGRS
jgi:amidase